MHSEVRSELNENAHNSISLDTPFWNDRSLNQISHELRTPLTSIIGFAEMLLDNSAMTDQKRLDYLRIIRDEGKRLEKLIETYIRHTSLPQ